MLDPESSQDGQRCANGWECRRLQEMRLEGKRSVSLGLDPDPGSGVGGAFTRVGGGVERNPVSAPRE